MRSQVTLFIEKMANQQQNELTEYIIELLKAMVDPFDKMNNIHKVILSIQQFEQNTPKFIY
jgi:hypothetical protein